MTTTDERHFQEWWKRTWKEKELLICNAYGNECVSEVIAYDWDDIDLRIPGACAMEFGPQKTNGMRYVVTSYGLSQPIGPEVVQGSQQPSGDGYEIAFASNAPIPWAAGLIQQLLTYVRQSSTFLGRGHRLPVWFRDSANGLIGKPEPSDIPFGEMRWIVLWPDFKTPGGFNSSTGYFNMYFCTTITAEEWSFAKRTSSSHLLLLLAETGCNQTSDLLRANVVVDEANDDRIQRISRLSAEQAEKELFQRYSI